MGGNAMLIGNPRVLDIRPVVNWRLMLESLYRAEFKIADDHLDDDVRRKIMRRVHEGWKRG
jgi:hypothetical protein